LRCAIETRGPIIGPASVDDLGRCVTTVAGVIGCVRDARVGDVRSGVSADTSASTELSSTTSVDVSALSTPEVSAASLSTMSPGDLSSSPQAQMERLMANVEAIERGRISCIAP